jgi:GNAT superfamily N-acetyltransferase
MDIKFRKAKFDEIDILLKEYIKSISGILDDLILKRKLKTSEIYIIYINSEIAGYLAINKEHKLLIQYYLKNVYKEYAESTLSIIRKKYEVDSALPFTCDKFFLNNVISMAEKIETEMYFFRAPKKIELKIRDFKIQKSGIDDIDFILAKTGDFFGNSSDDIIDQNIYFGICKEKVVAAGGIVPFPINKKYANISMFVFEEERKKGFGRSMIQYLILKCKELGYNPSAGCRSGNSNSKKTLESAGMYQSSKLLKIKGEFKSPFIKDLMNEKCNIKRNN